ncbi:MAG: hypothetical protein HGGPFJEG_01884 [Ignavibacteria bacterium]|nr:hypothetical protein [Ignavibacteria bacterium]
MIKEINKLSAEDFRKFECFIYSPYFNSFETLKKFFKYIKKAYPDITRKYISQKNISKHIYSEKKVNRLKNRKLLSDFRKLFEKFMFCEEVLADKTLSRFRLLKALRKRQYLKMYSIILEQTENEGEKIMGEDENYYFNKMILNEELYQHSISFDKKNALEFITKKTDNLNLYFIYQSLVFNYNLYSELSLGFDKSQKPVSTMVFVFDFVNKNLNKIKRTNPDIVTLYFANLMMMNEDFASFENLEKYYCANSSRFDRNLHTMYYIVCHNFLYNQITKNNLAHYERKLLQLRKLILENGHIEMYFMEGRILPQSIFWKIFINAVNLGDFEWAEKFFNETQKFMTEDEMTNINNAVSVILDFFKDKISDLPQRINLINKKDTRLYLYVRMIKIMFLFDSCEEKLLDYEIQSFEKFIERKLIHEKELQNLFLKADNFLKCIIILQKMKYMIETFKVSKLNDYESVYINLKVKPMFSFWFEKKMDKFYKSSKCKIKIKG